VLTSADLVGATRAECPPGVRVIGEPEGRNTAPAIGAAAVLFAAERERASFAVLPSDHLIDDVDAFTADFGRAFAAAEREPVLLTFGIPPTAPDTNFGYLRRGARVADRLYRVAAFKEKPDAARAAAWLAAGDYAWNSGMFVWRARTCLDALEAGKPELARPLRGMRWEGGDAGFTRALADVFPGLEKISVDYAVLESAPNMLMLEASFDWDDLGSWSAWARRQPHDPRGNVVFGDALALDCDDCIVVGEGGTAAALGLSGTIVVHAHGATLACPVNASQDVRRVTDAVRERNR
jgi:mannose-1-phosphate guanylyltransferase/mannose-6-phosphate isomerase